jgi:hypothetical protein
MAIGTRPGLSRLATSAEPARNALYYLDMLAALVLVLTTYKHPTAVTAVGCLLEGFGGDIFAALTYSLVVGHWSCASFGLRPGDVFGDALRAFALRLILS